VSTEEKIAAMVARRLIMLLLFSFGACFVQAQSLNLHFINFSSKDGLSSNTINVVLKDRFGFMWFGSEDGLSKFDGTRFTVYNHNAADTATIRSNIVMAIYEDREGRLWVGTSKGLSLYDREHDAFHNVNVTLGNSARTICADHNGNLWVGSHSGLFRYHPASGESAYYSSADGGKSHLASNMIISILEDSQQRLWIGSTAGLHLYQPATDDFSLFSGHHPDSVISDLSIKTLYEDHAGNVWVGTSDGGLNELPRGGNGFYSYKSIPRDVHTLSSNRIYSIAQEGDGNLWIGTEKGLNILDPRSGKVQMVSANERDKYSLRGSSIRSLFIDGKGIYWVGTWQSGVNKYDKNLSSFRLVQSNPFDPQGLSTSKITSFAVAPNDNLYVGTDGGGLNLYHPATGLFDQVAVGRQPLAVLALERAGNELWIGTFMQGIYVKNLSTGAVRHYYKDDGVSGLASDEIFCLRKDRYGNMWVGTNGKGVQVFTASKKTFQKLEDFIAGLSGDIVPVKGFIRAIEEDSEGVIWMSAIGRGIDSYDPATKTFRMYDRAYTGVPVDEVVTLLAGRNNVLWGGTGGRGICRLDFAHKEFKTYTSAQGLANDVVWKILEDSTGNLWVSTNKGISSFNPSQPGFKNFTYENGLQRSAFTLGAGLKLPNGEMYFGGLEGFNHFIPQKLNCNANIPQVIFTGLTVNNTAVVPGDHAAIKQQISMAREIRLDYKQNFSIDFAALDFTSPHECRYMYLLEGFDRSWNRIGTSTSAVFTNLDPGHYTLQVKAYNPNSGWTSPAATMSIYIKPPFWRTGYAYAGYIFLVLLILWGIRYRGIRRLKQKFAAEQEKAQIRQLIEEERKEVERQRAFDEVKIKFLTNLSHEFRTPISLIAGPVQTLLEEEADQEKKGQLSMVKRNTRRLLNLVNQLLDFRKLEEQELRINPSPGDIIAFVREVVESFKDLADRRHIEFLFHSTLESYYTDFDKDKMERLLFNLLSNAFKFTGRDGQVSLEVHKEADSGDIVIVVSDNGIGMSQDEQARIFDRFFQGETHPGIMNQGSGIGLSIAREFVRLHGGTIEVTSKYGQGSVFTVRLPLEELESPVIAMTGEQPVQTLTVIEPNGDKAQGPFLTVLLIEDNDDFRTYLRNQLKPFYKVIEAADGKEGWQKVLSGHPHVIVSDISMPYMDGITLSKKIKADKRTAHIPIILLTALTGDTYQLNGLRTGASDFLTKPFSAEILKVKIRNLASLNQHFKETYSRRFEVVTQQPEVASENEKLLLNITRLIEENMDDEKLSVEQLAKQLFMSRATLYNKVVDLTGETPVEFIRSVRLNKAAELLETSNLRMGEIGYAVGFLTPNYFARAFKAKFNMSPSEYAAMKKKPTG
jgi:signal transduction histidine kinase/ligand-binding sensor domain-containing protein/CheY-like chemotaxis protein/AraC-like DNA-binding protein